MLCPPILVSLRKNGQEEPRLLNLRRLGSSRHAFSNFFQNLPGFSARTLKTIPKTGTAFLSFRIQRLAERSLGLAQVGAHHTPRAWPETLSEGFVCVRGGGGAHLPMQHWRALLGGRGRRGEWGESRRAPALQTPGRPNPRPSPHLRFHPLLLG